MLLSFLTSHMGRKLCRSLRQYWAMPHAGSVARLALPADCRHHTRGHRPIRSAVASLFPRLTRALGCLGSLITVLQCSPSSLNTGDSVGPVTPFAAPSLYSPHPGPPTTTATCSGASGRLGKPPPSAATPLFSQCQRT